jgi:chromosome segregation ATPase
MICNIQITRFLGGLFLTLAIGAQAFAQSPENRTSDADENAKSKAQTSSLTDLEILARTEQRAESLRTRLFELQVQELNLQARIEDLDYQLMPDNIRQAVMNVGLVRPMEELRETWRKRLESEKARINKQLELLTSNREQLEAAISRVDSEIERLRKQLGLP